MDANTDKKVADKVVKSNDSKIWLFRILVLVGTGVFLAAWFLPWWNMDIEGFNYNSAQIRPWGLVVSEKLATFSANLKGTDLPVWFPYLMWVYFALVIIALLIGMLVRGPELRIGKIKFSFSQLMVGGAGFSFIFAGIFAAIYAGMRMQKTFNVPLQGRAHIDYGDPLIAYVNTSLEPGWYLLFVAGALLLVLAIFRDKITGEK